MHWTLKQRHTSLGFNGIITRTGALRNSPFLRSGLWVSSSDHERGVERRNYVICSGLNALWGTKEFIVATDYQRDNASFQLGTPENTLVSVRSHCFLDFLSFPYGWVGVGGWIGEASGHITALKAPGLRRVYTRIPITLFRTAWRRLVIS